MSKSNGWKSGSRKVGYKRYIGLVCREIETDIGLGWTKTEINLISRVWDKKGYPFGSDDTARKYAKRAMAYLKKGEI